MLFLETDGYAIEIVKEQFLYEKLKTLSDFIDFSQIPRCCTLFNNSKINCPGVLKLEAVYVKSFVALRSKTYSILEVYPTLCKEHERKKCVACSREISKGAKLSIAHQRYKDVLNGVEDGMCEYFSFTSCTCDISYSKKKRNVLSVNDGSRIFVNKIDSIPVGLLTT